MFKEHTTEEIIQMIEETEDEIIIRIPKEKNYTLNELRQKLINYLTDLDSYEGTDVEIIKVLFGTNKIMFDSKKIKENLF